MSRLSRAFLLTLAVVLGLAACTSGGAPTAPAAPSDLTATPRSGAAVLRWLDNSANEESFEVERRLGDGDFELLQAVSSNTIELEVALGGVGEHVSFRVRAVNDIGASAYSNTTTIVVVGVGADGGTIEAGAGVTISIDQETLSGDASLPVVVDATPERPYQEGVTALGPSTKFTLRWGLLSLESVGYIRLTVPRYTHVPADDPDATDLAAIFLNSSRPHLYAITYVPYDRASGALAVLGAELLALAHSFELPDVVEIIVEPIDLAGWRVVNAEAAGIMPQSNSEKGLYRVRVDDFDVGAAKAVCGSTWQESAMVAGVTGIPGKVPASDKPPLLLIHGWQVLGNYQTFKKRHSDEGWTDGLWQRLLATVAPIHGQPLYRYAPQVCTWVDMLERLEAGHVDQHYEIYTFAYDSELGIVSNAARLKAAIDQFDPDSRVTLLAHSMGGLLANAYIHANGAARINHVITLGTPYRGTSALVCSIPSCTMVSLLFDTLTVDAALAITGATVGPAALATYSTLKTLISAATRHPGTKNLAWDNPTLSALNAVERDYGRYTSFYADLTGDYDLVGAVVKTLTGHDNDGIVPLDSARLVMSDTPRIADARTVGAVPHTELPRDLTTMLAVLGLLREVVPDSGDPPPAASSTTLGAGTFHTLALNPDGNVWAWGGNGYGQLGDGTTTQRLTPVQVTGLSNVTSLAGGDLHSLAVRTDGTVWGWGGNGDGRLGDGTTTHRHTPVRASGLTNVTSIATGMRHSLALRTDGTVWAWGHNSDGQLGDGTTTRRLYPVRVAGLTDVTSIATGSWHSMALRTDGTVWAWGDNGSGQLGDGTTRRRLTPVQVSGLTNVTRIATAGWGHALALRADGSVWAWGMNVDGRLGDGTTTRRLTPVQVSGLTNVTRIAAGSRHSLALRTDGTVWAWGHNGNGQLGNGTLTRTLVPWPVSGLSNVTSIAAGDWHSLALRTDGTVWAWGDNGSGQLGDGTTTHRLTPVRVSGF